MRVSRRFGSLALAALVSTMPGLARARVPGPRKCAAAKIEAVGREVCATAKCQQKAITRGVPVDGGCLAKAETKLQADVAKADAAGACSGTAAALEGQVDAFIATLVGGIQPGTTTTSTSTTTTSTLPASFGCCRFPSSTFCTWTTAESCTQSSGVPGDAGSVCDSATGTCTPPPATAGPCCTVTFVGPPSGSVCLASPRFDPSSCQMLAERDDPRSTGTFSIGVCPSPGVACVP